MAICPGPTASHPTRPNTPKGTNNLDIPEEVAKIAKAGHQVVLANGNNGDW